MEGLLVLLVYGGIGLGMLALGVVVYMFAVSSRKSYRCPQCGERMTTEYLDARRCGMCGAKLQRDE